MNGTVRLLAGDVIMPGDINVGGSHINLFLVGGLVLLLAVAMLLLLKHLKKKDKKEEQ